LFTTDENILELVAQNDDYFNNNAIQHIENVPTVVEELRPLTADISDASERPYTCPRKRLNKKSKSVTQKHTEIKREPKNSKANKNDNKKLSLLDMLGIPNSKNTKFNFKMVDVSSIDDLIENDLEKYLVENDKKHNLDRRKSMDKGDKSKFKRERINDQKLHKMMSKNELKRHMFAEHGYTVLDYDNGGSFEVRIIIINVSCKFMLTFCFFNRSQMTQTMKISLSVQGIIKFHHQN